MSFAQLREALMAEAEEQAAQIRQRYDEQYAHEEARIKDRVRTREEQLITDAKEAATLEAKRQRQHAQLTARADVLRAKQAELERILQLLHQDILGWNERETTALLTALLELLPSDHKDGTLVAGSHHADLLRSLVKRHGYHVASDTLPDEGGFLYRGSDTEINLTLSYLVQQLFARHRARIAQILFR